MPDEPTQGYRPDAWYWFIGGDSERLWASAEASYVASDDGEYRAWLVAGGMPTRIASEEELDFVLASAGHGDRAPHPPKRTVPKSVIVSRLIEAGKIGAAYKALNSNPEYWARWVASDRPAINYDDPDALALLMAIGADPDVILGP